MLAVGIIEPVEESDWVSLMVVQEKKQKAEICICVDLWKHNVACDNDPLPTPFTSKVLENVRKKKCIPLQMGSLDTIRSRSRRRMEARQHLLRNGVAFSI